ncbi:TetR/AcrR family transcriptional regulator [Companilactobacillus baiquanensis]|uniref:TetR/AcrR family transcriptional regulator n=1 Tax=Companilactobacillus baiquanensis TaxID=2486005 RepID=A0ABW1V0B7_9LACO|nr:TetR/AcrR family transcriptional regulator [Companilactobacillus baiquanensis]
MKIDKRVQRTNQALKKSFRDLSKIHKYRDITVKELTDNAKINRKTFYLHYDSIDDFVNTFAGELADQLLEIIAGKSLHDTLTHPADLFDGIVDYFEQSRDFYSFVLTSDDYSFLSRKVERLVCDGFASALKESFNITQIDAYISASFMIRNTLMLFRLYEKGQVQLTKEEFKDRLIRLNQSGLKTFLN